MTPSPELAASIDIYKKTHEAYQNYFTGYSLIAHVPEIIQLSKNSNIQTCIDYGCGRARAWKEMKLNKLFLFESVYLYDPGIEEFSERPSPADMVICTDVLEHVPEACVDEVLKDICSLAKKIVFLSITTKPASKKLIDGTNAHATVKPKEWWQNKLNALDKAIIAHYCS